VTLRLGYLWPGTIIAFENRELKVKEEGLLFYEGFDDEDSINSWSPNPSNQWGVDAGLVLSSARFIASDQYLNGTLTKTVSLSGSGVLVVYGLSESSPIIVGGGSEIGIDIDGTYYSISACSDAWEYRKIPISSGTHTLTIRAYATDPGYGANIDHLMIVKSLNIVIQGLKPGWIIEIKGSDLNGNPITITITAGSSQVVIDCEQYGLYHWPLKDVTITLYRTSE